MHFHEWKCSINFSLKFLPKGLINNIPALVQIMAWRWPGHKPLSEPMMVNLLTNICVTRPQWVKATLYRWLSTRLQCVIKGVTAACTKPSICFYWYASLSRLFLIIMIVADVPVPNFTDASTTIMVTRQECYRSLLRNIGLKQRLGRLGGRQLITYFILVGSSFTETTPMLSSYRTMQDAK